MNTMSYKGYTARIEYDPRDDTFVGRVLGVREIISFHANAVLPLHEAFHLALDDYLADCDERAAQASTGAISSNTAG
ncbi:type II toxin-antitoxin system HicB family antitoxin [Pseudomonas tructae]|uniref:type II toxin-antitoxin system HicB family antitoxin n=1 Tax=Pseudomonas tructae TaxID=2518644 RepID=UPI001E647860|nr:type II toxin-antitoxin system HicB family antitoxin [Pseudomonas tructae]